MNLRKVMAGYFKNIKAYERLEKIIFIQVLIIHENCGHQNFKRWVVLIISKSRRSCLTCEISMPVGMD